jgi:hypothetical protein
MLFSIFSSQGVTFAEMSPSPVLCIQGDILRIEVSNSVFHSSKVITEVEFIKEQDMVVFKGWQKVAPLKNHNGVFERKLSDLGLNPEQGRACRYFWQDPDGTRTEILLTE